MEFHSPEFVYECVPPVLNNERSEEPVVVGLQVLTLPEQDAEIMAQRGLGAEAISRRTMALVKGKIKFIRGLKVDGQEITDFDSFYKLAPPELVSWVMSAIYRTSILSGAERKNS